MNSDLTPSENGEYAAISGAGLPSRVDDLVALFTIVHQNMPDFDGAWRNTHQDLFKNRLFPREADLEGLLWHLVFSSFVRSVDEVSGELHLQGKFAPQGKQNSNDALEIVLEDICEVDWRSSLLDGKMDFENLLEMFARLYGKWHNMVAGSEREKVEALISDAFVNNFRSDCLINYQIHQELLTITPSTWACIDPCFTSWMSFVEKFQHDIRQPIEGEKFSLNEIYIDLRCSFLKKVTDDDGGVSAKRLGACLDKSVIDWLDEESSSLLAVVGCRGSGRSSFCRMFFAQNAMSLYRKGITIFVITLNGLEKSNNLKSFFNSYLSQVAALNFDPLSTEYLNGHRVLLILDSIDHSDLSHQKREESMRGFIQEAKRLCARSNREFESLRLQMIFVGNSKMASSCVDVFHGSNLLEILPFFPGNGQSRRWWPELGINGKAFSDTDQSREWWERWSKLTGKSIPRQIAKGISFGAGAIESLPFFNSLISNALPKLSHAPSKELSIGVIYLSLLDSFHKTVDPSRKVHRDTFLICLEEVSVWVGSGEVLNWNVKEIHKHLNRSRFLKYFLTEEIDILLAEVIHTAVSFFSTTERKSHDFSYYEYLIHDYLIAARLLRIIRSFCENQISTSVDQGTCNDVSVNRDLLLWTTMTAAMEMNYSIFTFLRSLLRSELDLLSEKDQARWQSVFAEIFSNAVIGSVPIDRVEGYTTYREMVKGSRNAEITLIVALGGIAAVTQRVSPVEWSASDPQALGSWLMRMNGQHVDYQSSSLGYGVSQIVSSTFILDSLNYLDFSHQVLSVQNFSSASLRGVMFSKVILSRSSLRHADMRDAFMEQAQMREVTMNHANLSGANLDYADLIGARMEGCQMSRASLLHALLNQANLNDAKLDNCAFSGAKLDDALMKYTVLDDARMNGASMRGVNFHGASMIRCNLDDITASTASFDHTNLSDASLIGGVLNECNFSDATLAGACLYRVEMKSAHFLNCQMSGVNLEVSNLSETTFRECDLQSSSFNKADLSGTSFAPGCSLHRASLIGVRLHGAVFDHVDFRMALFEKAQASGETHFIECDLSGADFSEVNLESINISGNLLEGAVFIGAHLKSANLNEANLKRAVMDRANLSNIVMTNTCLDEASLFQVNLQKSRMKNTSLKSANLHGADLEESDLRGANFSDASLFGASLRGADLRNADLSGASLFGTNVEGALLSEDQLSDEQKEQIRGVPNWVYPDEKKLLNSSGKSLTTNIHETVVQDSEQLVDETRVSSVTSGKDERDRH